MAEVVTIREPRIASEIAPGVGASLVPANEPALLCHAEVVRRRERSRTGYACRAEINEGGSRRSSVAAVYDRRKRLRDAVPRRAWTCSGDLGMWLYVNHV